MQPFTLAQAIELRWLRQCRQAARVVFNEGPTYNGLIRLCETGSMHVMFLDESGDHSLTIIDPQYPVFVLGGVIIDKDYADGQMTDEVQQFKQDLFGRDDIVLHTADIARNKNGFERLKDPKFRSRFYRELNSLMSRLQYKVVACAIKKDMHAARYGIAALDPYMLSLHVLVERFCYEIGGDEQGGVIVVERRDPVLDKQLDLAW
jgi:hypothetical protein